VPVEGCLTVEKAYRANRSFGALEEGEVVTFQDGDPVLTALLGTGYMDPVYEPESSGTGIASSEAVGTPTVSTKEKEKSDE
jgi:hypothetical protein